MCKKFQVLLYILFEAVSAEIEPVLNISSFHCSPWFLVARRDYSLFQFHVQENDTNLNFSAPHRPVFHYTFENNTKIELCSAFNLLTGKCMKRQQGPDQCWCVEHSPNVYHLSYNITADRSLSRGTLSLEVAGFSAQIPVEFEFPEVKEKCPIELIHFTSSPGCKDGFLQDGTDYTFITFQLSGNDSQYTAEAGHAAEMFYTTGRRTFTRRACKGFDEDCSERAPGPCTCERVNSTSPLYRITYKKLADVYASNGTAYLVWPGNPGLKSRTLRLPKVKGRCDVKSPQYLGLIGTLSVLFVIVDGLLWVLISYARMRSQENEERARREAERERTPAQRAPLADTTSVGSAASRRSPSSKPSLTSGSSSELFSSLLETSQ